MRAGFFFPGNRDRTRGSGLKLCQGRLMLNIRKNFRSESVKYWNGLPRKAVRSLSLEVFKEDVCDTWGDVLVGMVVIGWQSCCSFQP